MDTFEGGPSDPLSLHKYLYCQANPINRLDPSGETDFVSTMMSSFIVGNMMTHYLGASSATIRSVRAQYDTKNDFAALSYGADVLFAVVDSYQTATGIVGGAALATYGAFKTISWLRQLSGFPIRGVVSGIQNLVKRKGAPDYESVDRAVKYLQILGVNVFVRAEKSGAIRGAGTSDLVIAGSGNGASGLDADVYQPLTEKISGIIDGIVAKDNQADIIILDLAKTTVRPEDLGDIMAKVQAKNASRIRDVIVIPK